MIHTKGLSHTFAKRGRKGEEVVAVAGIDLDVEAGQIVGFLGPNGAGKTTTMRMLVTLLPPTGGTATVAGLDLLREPAGIRRRIGYVAQGGSSDAAVSGRRELILQARVFGASKREAQERAADLLERFELTTCADRPTGTWSGGQRRRLDIALGLVHRPELLFLDEPTTGLDPQSRANLWDEVRSLRAEGTTIFLTTHYLDEADALADQLFVVDHGEIVATGTPDELKNRIGGDVVTISMNGDRHKAANLLEAQSFVNAISQDDGELRMYVDRGDTAATAILRLLDSAGMPPESLNLSRPSLDDVFLELTGRSLRDAA